MPFTGTVVDVEGRGTAVQVLRLGGVECPGDGHQLSDLDPMSTGAVVESGH